MANYDMPPEMADFVEGCESVAMDAFDPATFEADPSAAFADTMGAVMDYMGECGMPPEMMSQFQDVATGCFDSYMGENPDAAPMECFDVVGAGIDLHMGDMPPDMNCADMAEDFPPPPEDFGEFINECPPCGSFEGGENFDPGAHPHCGGMADMIGGPGDMPPQGDMGSGPDGPQGPDGDAMGPEPSGPDPLFGENAPGQDMGQPPGGDAMDNADHAGRGPAEHGPGEPPQPMGPEAGQQDPSMDQMSADMDAQAGMTGQDTPSPDDLPPGDMADAPDMPPPEDDPSDAGGA